jgi:DNA invertase Pin-like site-specific DNA recombinase
VNNNVIAIYIRISNDDGNADESNSIKNQRTLLQQHIAADPVLSQYSLIEFCDDGYSGTNFNRLNVTQLLEKVRKHEVQCIVVKDFSRFGRSYIDVGNYLEQIFPFYGVRFISVNDNYDSNQTNDSFDGIDAALKTLIYDLYSKDLSVKSKSGLDAKKRRGMFAASKPPYGYGKSKNAKNGLEVDEETAGIVRYIFDLAVEGKGRTETALILNNKGIPTRSGNKNGFWQRGNISDIIRNEAYTGAAIANKKRQASIGGKQVSIPQDEWTIIRDAHPAIINTDTFDKANMKSKPYIQHNRNNIQATAWALNGKVRCHCCNYVLRRNGKAKPVVYCETPRVRSSPNCVREPIDVTTIECAVTTILRNHILLFLDNKRKHGKVNGNKNNTSLITQLEQTVERHRVLVQRLYEEYNDGKITKSEYLQRKSEANIQRTKTEQQLVELKNKIAALSNISNHQNTFKWENFINHNNLTPELVNSLIETVIVYGSDRIEVQLKYADGFK